MHLQSEFHIPLIFLSGITCKIANFYLQGIHLNSRLWEDMQAHEGKLDFCLEVFFFQDASSVLFRFRTEKASWMRRNIFNIQVQLPSFKLTIITSGMTNDLYHYVFPNIIMMIFSLLSEMCQHI